MHYHFKIHKEGDGFWAECIEIPACFTQADSKEELFDNMREAINLCLQEPSSSKYLAPLPNPDIKCTTSVVAVPVDPAIAFGFSVRYHRMKEGLTQKEAAQKLGLESIFSYQRLERKCNATLEVIAKVMSLFPNFSADLVCSS